MTDDELRRYMKGVVPKPPEHPGWVNLLLHSDFYGSWGRPDEDDCREDGSDDRKSNLF